MTLRNKIAYNSGGLLPFPTFHYGRSASGYSLVSSLQKFRKGYRYYPCPIALDTTRSQRTYGTPVPSTLFFQQSYSLYDTSALGMHRRPFSFGIYTPESMRHRCTNLPTNKTTITTCRRTYSTPVTSAPLFQQSYSLFETSALRMHRRPFSFVDTTHTLENMCRRYTSFLISNTDNTLKSMRRRCTDFIIGNTANTLESMRRRCISFVTQNIIMLKSVRRRCTNFVTINILSYG